ncbi:MAG: TonB-dependent receptor [Chlorobi bacterium]|nr:MAG: TonB-dependent receptor [Chlorobi bacterium OLB7]MBK8910994.1 TonB-dependent receptor [Chlorobiota bacterium]MBX7216724.1 TonB-dependent receptor [Candidatus Kapabacteria bacterium]
MKSTHLPFYLLIAAIALLAGNATAQQASVNGIINGRVVNDATGEPIIGGSVAVQGTRLGAYTNVNGYYTIRNVPAGTYTLKVTSVGYATKSIEQVKVDGGRTIQQDIALSVKTLLKDEVVVVARADRQSESAALIERRRSATVSDAISADQISKAPASDAGDAMKRVTGVSVVGKKYVVVRGLTERYSATQLNGVNLPSPEPEKKVVPFDLFPAGLISRLTTIKTFTPDNPGDFAGGLVQINTKDYPESFLLNASVGTGINSQTHGANAIGYSGGGTDFFGIDDGTRQLPGNIAPGRRQTAAEQADLLSQFTNNVWTPRSETLPINQSYSISIGNQFDVGFPLGFLASGSLANSSNYRVEEQRYPLLSQTNGEQDLRYDYDVQHAERSSLWGGLVSLGAQFMPEHKVSIRGVYNHSTDDETRNAEGLYNQSTAGIIRNQRLRFLERALWSGQIAGEHYFPALFESKIDWRAAISQANRYEPDNRSTTYFREDDGSYRFANNFGSNNGRFFSDLNDDESNIGLDWSIPFTGWDQGKAKVKLGGLVRLRDRQFSARRFTFITTTSNDAILTQAPEQLFTPENVRNGFMVFNDDTQPNDNYNADEKINAGYVMIDLPLTTGLRFIGGARYESWDLNLLPFNIETHQQNTSLAVDLNQTDLLPSANLIYQLSDQMNLRGAFSQTLARPEFRELAPFRFDDYRQSTYGNPSLVRTQITNYDLRWEWFPRGNEVIAASFFYKDFKNPIEQFYLIGGSDIAVEPANATMAVSYGAEIEFRKGLDELLPELEGFGLGMNLTLVQSEVTFGENDFVSIFDGVGINPYSSQTLTNRTRPLQGQSPYVINATLGYENSSWGTGVTLLYNVFGKRLVVVGTNGIPDTYEQPQNTLDLTIAQKLPAGLQLKLSAKNLLDSETLYQQEFRSGSTINSERYLSGRSISISLGFNFHQFDEEREQPLVSGHE